MAGLSTQEPWFWLSKSGENPQLSRAASLLPSSVVSPVTLTITKIAIIMTRTYISVCYVSGAFLSTITLLTHLMSTHNLLYNPRESGDRNCWSEL